MRGRVVGVGELRGGVVDEAIAVSFAYSKMVTISWRSMVVLAVNILPSVLYVLGVVFRPARLGTFRSAVGLRRLCVSGAAAKAISA